MNIHHERTDVSLCVAQLWFKKTDCDDEMIISDLGMIWRANFWFLLRLRLVGLASDFIFYIVKLNPSLNMGLFQVQAIILDCLDYVE